MKTQYLKYIVLLEKAIADFYKNLKEKRDYERIKTILEFMETHSSEHAERIREFDDDNPSPVIEDELILKYQNKINSHVKKRIMEENDLPEILRILAEAEEEIGKMYVKFSDYFDRLSDYYKEISAEMSVIASEENNHRDLLLMDREKLLKKKQKNNRL